MSVPSNSQFFAVHTPAALESVGWEVRVLDHTDYTTEIAVLTDWVSLSIAPELDAPGAGSVTCDADSPFWSTQLPDGRAARTLLDVENVFEVYEDGALRFQFLGRNVDEKLLEDDERRGIVISGPGAADALRFAQLLPPNFPAPPPPLPPISADPSLARGHWDFPAGWTAMKMWLTVLRECQARGTIPWVTPLFDDATDSGGAAWQYIPTQLSVHGYGFAPEMGADLLAFLDQCTGQDFDKWFAERVEWVMWPGHKLDVRKTIGSHREDQVVFHEGEMIQKERTRSREDIHNYVVVRDLHGGTSLAVDSASIAKWGRREKLETGNPNITNPATRNILAQIFLEQQRDEKSQWVVQVPYDTTRRRPFRDFNVGDWIGISTFQPATESTVDAFRVLTLAVNVQDETPTVELTLQSKLDYRIRQLDAKLTDVINRVNNVTNPYATPLNPSTGLPYTGPVTSTWDPLTGSWQNSTPNTATTTGRGGGIRVFIQDTDPAAEAQPGDFWYNTAYTAQPGFTYTPDTSELPVSYDGEDSQSHIPGTQVYFNAPRASHIPNTNVYFEPDSG